MKRVTKTRLKNMVNEALVRLETGFTCLSIEKSRFRGQDYEGGAYHWRAMLQYKDVVEPIIKPYIMCFLPFDEFQGCVDGTHILTLKVQSRATGHSIHDYEIWPQKK